MKIAVPYKNSQAFQNFVTPHSSRSRIIHNYDSWQGFGQSNKHTLSHQVLCIAKATPHQICESSLIRGSFYFIGFL